MSTAAQMFLIAMSFAMGFVLGRIYEFAIWTHKLITAMEGR